MGIGVTERGIPGILVGTLMTCTADKRSRQLEYDCSPSVQSQSTLSQLRDIDGEVDLVAPIAKIEESIF